MRTIKFRGKNLKWQWHYGLLCHDKTKDSDYEWFISNSVGKPYAFGAMPETIGQFTGLHDKNGKEIYEGDIVRGVGVTSYEKPIIRRVSFDDASARFGLADVAGNITFEPLKWISFPLEIIGNIYENPELLGVSEV